VRGASNAPRDLAAVQAHIASLSSSAARIEADITAGEGAFLAALADAALDAYKRDALAFVSQHVPQLHSIVRRLWKQTGKGPEWELTVFSGLKILWYEDVLKKASAHHQAERELVVLWPRGDQALVSGAPIISDELVDGLITEIRSAAAKEIA